MTRAGWAIRAATVLAGIAGIVGAGIVLAHLLGATA